jgi:hypothetical protein
MSPWLHPEATAADGGRYVRIAQGSDDTNGIESSEWLFYLPIIRTFGPVMVARKSVKILESGVM